MADPEEKPDPRKEKAMKIRRKLRAIAIVVAAIDHVEYIGAYALPQNVEKLAKLIEEKQAEWDGVEVRALPVPDLRVANS